MCSGCGWRRTGTVVENPAFDVTPHRYVTGIITERGRGPRAVLGVFAGAGGEEAMKVAVIALAGTLSLAAAGDYSNRRAPGFSLTDSHYQQHDPQDYRGKVLLIDIMATGCPTCIRLADTLVELKAKYGDKLAIISVVTAPDNFQTADAFAAEHRITWPLVFDMGQMIASYLKVTPSNPRVQFPHLFLIDGNGTIRNDYGEGDSDALTAARLSAEIDELSRTR